MPEPKRQRLSFNTQPPEGGWQVAGFKRAREAGFNTQPPEGGWHFGNGRTLFGISFNTQPPEGGWPTCSAVSTPRKTFQHTAA